MVNGVWIGSPVTETVIRAFHQHIPLTVLAGGSYAGKTASALAAILLLAQEQENLRIAVFCANFPLLKRDALHFWDDMLKRVGIPYEHQKTHHIYRIGSCTVEFRALDSEGTARGAKQDISYIVEVNLIDKLRYDQIMMRTNRMMLCCFNPVQKFWLIDQVIPFQTNHVFKRFTYRDNPFTPEKVKATLEGYKLSDKNLYNVYNLGLWGSTEGTVYDQPSLIDRMPTEDIRAEGYGLDFGFSNDPTAVVECALHRTEKKIYIDEIFYQTGQTVAEVGSYIRPIVRSQPLFCDSANPEGIEQLRRMGMDARPAKKVRGSVQMGIDYLKQYQWFVTARSTNVLKEVQRYTYRQLPDGSWTNEPKKSNDHLMDAIRYYALMSMASFKTRRLRAISY